MASPSRQDVKNFLFPSSSNEPGATTQPFLRSQDAQRLSLLAAPPLSEMVSRFPLPAAPPIPMPPLQARPAQYEHKQKRRHLLMRPPAPLVPSPLRTAVGESDNDPSLPSPLNVGLPSGMPTFRASFVENAKPAAATRYADQGEIAAAAQSYHYYLEPSARLLAQNLVIDMGYIRPGLYDGKVGLLPGLHGDFMENYEVCAMCPHTCINVDPDLHKANDLLSYSTPMNEIFPYPDECKRIHEQKPPKGQRAPREDLSPYTAEEKVERRKARAREYSTVARKRQEAIETEFKLHLGYMRSFRVIMEEGPNMVAVVAPNLEANMLYANGAFRQALEVPPKRLLGRSLWELLHQADHFSVRNALISVVLSKNSPPSHVPCRLLAPKPDICLRAQVSLAMGTQGVICVFWEA